MALSIMCERKRHLEQICSFIEENFVTSDDEVNELGIAEKIGNYLKKEDTVPPDTCEILRAVDYACFMDMRTPGDAKRPFQPMITCPDGKNSGSVEDLPDQYVELYQEIIDHIDSSVLKARIADILWLKKRDHTFASIAIDAYKTLSFPIASISFDSIRYLERAIVLCKQLKARKLCAIKKEITEVLFAKKIQLTMEFFKLAQLAFKHQLLDQEQKKQALDRLSKKVKADYIQPKSRSLPFARNVLNFCNQNFASNQQAEKAKCSEDIVWAYIYEAENQQALIQHAHYNSAIEKYNHIPKKYRSKQLTQKIESMKKELPSIGKKAISNMQAFSCEQDITPYIKQVQAEAEKITNLSDGCTWLMHNINVPKQNDTDGNTQTPLLDIAQNTVLSDDGRKVGDGDDLTSYRYNFIISLSVRCLLVFMEQLEQKGVLSETSMREQIDHLKPVMPSNQQQLISRALFLGFSRNFHDAIFLVCPLVESIIRHILKGENIDTTHIDEKGIQDELGIATLLKNHEQKLQEILGDCLYHEINLVFGKDLGINLRNNVLHGIVSDQDLGSYTHVYAWFLMFKLLFSKKNGEPIIED